MQEDWADERRSYTREEHDAAFLRIDGRKVDLSGSRLDFDSATNRLTVASGSQTKHRREAAVPTVAHIVRENPGITSGKLRAELRFRGNTNYGNQTAAMYAAQNERLVHAKPGPKNSRRWFAGPSSDDPLIVASMVEVNR